MSEHTMKVSGYLKNAFDVKARQKIVRGIVGQLKGQLDKFDAIAVRGTSGVLIGSMVADRLKRPMIVVRKPEEKSHASYGVEGPIKCRYIIIDDLICSGSTVKKIQEDIHANCSDSKCVGIALYHNINQDEAICHKKAFFFDMVIYQESGRWNNKKDCYVGNKWLTES